MKVECIETSREVLSIRETLSDEEINQLETDKKGKEWLSWYYSVINPYEMKIQGNRYVDGEFTSKWVQYT